MKICLFGAASTHIHPKYVNAVKELSKKLALRGHSLVFGAGATGLMGAAARGFKEGGGYIFGVIPKFFRQESIELIFEDCNEIIYTETMSERKARMENEAEAFITVPGGIGTFEEFFEVLTLKQLGRHNKPMILFDIDGYYNDLENFMQTATKRQFITEECTKLYSTFTDADEAINYLENYTPNNLNWLSALKHGTKK